MVNTKIIKLKQKRNAIHAGNIIKINKKKNCIKYIYKLLLSRLEIVWFVCSFLSHYYCDMLNKKTQK